MIHLNQFATVSFTQWRARKSGSFETVVNGVYGTKIPKERFRKILELLNFRSRDTRGFHILNETIRKSAVCHSLFRSISIDRADGFPYLSVHLSYVLCSDVPIIYDVELISRTLTCKSIWPNAISASFNGGFQCHIFVHYKWIAASYGEMAEGIRNCRRLRRQTTWQL